MNALQTLRRQANRGRAFAILAIAGGAFTLVLGLSGCAKTSSGPGPDPTSTQAAPDPNSLHGTGGQFLVDPNAQVRWTYDALPNPTPSSKPNYLLKSFLFEAGSSTLNPEAKGTLGDLVELLAEKPAVRVVCIGLCDGNTEKVNAENLGMNRAAAARKFLLDKGVAKERIEMASFGSTRAQAPPEETIGQRLDRKVEVWLLSE